MKVAVTGSSGLLGRHIVADLVAGGHEVLGIDTSPPPAGTRATHVSADATELGALVQLTRGIDVLVHAAAIPRPTGRDPATVFRTNTLATYAAVEAAALAGAGRLVYASSFSVLGYPFFERPVVPASLPVDESAAIGAQDPYALSKWLGEETVEAAVRRGAVASAVSLRMPWIQTADTFHREVGPRRRTPDASRDLWGYCDARDAAVAFRLAVERGPEGHHRLLLSAADTYMVEPTEALVRRVFPDATLTRAMPGHAAVIDTQAARNLLGWQPDHSWRDYPVDSEEDL